MNLELNWLELVKLDPAEIKRNRLEDLLETSNSTTQPRNEFVKNAVDVILLCPRVGMIFVFILFFLFYHVARSKLVPENGKQKDGLQGPSFFYFHLVFSSYDLLF